MPLDLHPVPARRLTAFAHASIALIIGGALFLPRSASAQTYAGEPETPSAWRQIRMDGLTVTGTARPGELEQVANGIAAFGSAMTTLLPNIRLTGPVPTFVVVMRDFQAYKQYQPRDTRGRRIETIAGYVNVTADANFVVFPYVRGEVGSSLIFHEYTHYMLRQNVDTDVPLWLEEGLAEFNATFRPDFGDGSLLGTAPPDRIRTLRQEPYVPLRHLVSPLTAGQIVKSVRSGVFYAEAWALVHYITLERKNPVPEPFSVYLTTLADTDSQDEAFKAAFGVDVEGMDRELQDYVKHYSFKTIFIPQRAAAIVGTPEPIPDEDVKQIEAALLGGRDVPDEFDADLRPF